MSETIKRQQTVVEQVRGIRDELNRTIEATTGEALLDHIRQHQYENPFLRRLASRVTSRPKNSEVSHASH